MNDTRATQYVSLQHEGQIRDLKFNSEHASSSVAPNVSGEPLLLSCSVDKTVRLTSLQSNASKQVYTCAMPVWSVTWSAQNRWQFFAGLSNGCVLLFDTRQPTTPVFQFNTPALDARAPGAIPSTSDAPLPLPLTRTPVVSLQFLPFAANRSFRYVKPYYIPVWLFVCTLFCVVTLIQL